MQMIYHSDGDVSAVIDLYIEAGFDCLHPLEAKTGLDLRDLVGRYGDTLALFGNVNVVELSSNDRARIEAEVAAKLVAGKSGRCYIYHSDHSVPPGVSWQSYQFVIELLDRYGGY
jgi:uroporphyrinogen decarboxylase